MWSQHGIIDRFTALSADPDEESHGQIAKKTLRTRIENKAKTAKLIFIIIRYEKFIFNFEKLGIIYLVICRTWVG
jgi:hypothetical protein